MSGQSSVIVDNESQYIGQLKLKIEINGSKSCENCQYLSSVMARLKLRGKRLVFHLPRQVSLLRHSMYWIHSE